MARGGPGWDAPSTHIILGRSLGHVCHPMWDWEWRPHGTREGWKAWGWEKGQSSAGLREGGGAAGVGQCIQHCRDPLVSPRAGELREGYE